MPTYSLADVTHRTLALNSISLHIAEIGSGPLVICCHGFPEGWYAWRHQLPALANAGYHVVAPDMRGYGSTSAPASPDAYTMVHHVGDLTGLLDALGEQQAVVIGHDWGSFVTWHAGLLRPDRFPAIVTMSVPFAPRGPLVGERADQPPSAIYRLLARGRFFYQSYFMDPARHAEHELDADPARTLALMMVALSGDATPEERFHPFNDDPDATLFGNRPTPTTLPSWLTSEELATMAAEFAGHGFSGGLNWYRAIDRTWELTAPWSGAPVTVPTLFLWGERDPLLEMPQISRQIEAMDRFVPRLRKQAFPACGHWIQLERSHEVNAAIVAFLTDVAPVAR